jgi:DNA-binding CsgD family transcriptional regulator
LQGGSEAGVVVSIRLSSYLRAVKQLRRSDLEAVLDVVAAAHASEEPAPFTRELLDGLADLTGCDYVTYNAFESDTGVNSEYIHCSAETNPHPEPTGDWPARQRTWHARGYGFSGRPGVHRLSEFFTRRERKSPLVNGNYPLYGVNDEIWLLLERSPTRTASIGFSSFRDLSDRQRHLAELLHPHLIGAYRGGRLRQRFEATVGAADSLTPREREVMRCVADGLSNAEIARVLVVELSTVRKHLEHVFDKLGVRSRTAAVAALRG